MVDRVPAPDYDPQASLRPVAAPVDTFVLPQRDNDLQQLLGALGRFDNKLAAFAAKEREETKVEDAEAGRAAALKSALSDAEAIKKGIIRPNESKWFMKGYREQYGRVLGTQISQEARVAWSQWEGRNSEDPKAYQEWIADFTKKALSGIQDPDTLLGAAPLLDGLNQSLGTAQANYTADMIYNKHLDNVGAQAGTLVENFANGALTEEQLLRSLSTLDTESVKLMGIEGGDFNKALLKTVLAVAEQRGSTKLLSIYEKHKAQLGLQLTPDERTALGNATQSLRSQAIQMENLAYTREARAREEAERSLFSAALPAIFDSGGNVPLDQMMVDVGGGKQQSLLDLAATVSPSLVLTLENARLNQAEESRRTDPLAYSLLQGQVIEAARTGQSFETLILEAAAGQSISPSETKTLYEMGRAAKESDILEDNIVRNYRAEIDRYSDPEFKFDYDPERVSNATTTFDAEMLKWAAANPAATNTEIQKKAAELKQQLIEYVRDAEKPVPGQKAEATGAAPSDGKTAAAASAGADVSAEITPEIRLAYQMAVEDGDYNAQTELLNAYPGLLKE